MLVFEYVGKDNSTFHQFLFNNSNSYHKQMKIMSFLYTMQRFDSYKCLEDYPISKSVFIFVFLCWSSATWFDVLTAIILHGRCTLQY